MALWTQPEVFLITALGHLVCRGIAGMPLLRKPRVIRHGSAWAEFASIRVAVRADCVAPIFCQMVNTGLPVMLPAAFVDAARAPQPDFLCALVREISRHLALVAGWVPHSLDELVRGVCQRLLPLAVEPRACDKICKCYG
jgi:hypothetical protein